METYFYFMESLAQGCSDKIVVNVLKVIFFLLISGSKMK